MQGIAVAMATKIPPHNVHEVVAALKALIENRNITTAELMQHIPGPDFPTGMLLISFGSAFWNKSWVFIALGLEVNEMLGFCNLVI